MMKAITIKEISGNCIEIIPVGTEFEIIKIGKMWSSCRSLGVTLIWNDEYKLYENDEKIVDK